MADQNNNAAQGGGQPNINVIEGKDKFEEYTNAVSAEVTGNEVKVSFGRTKSNPNGQGVSVVLVGDLYMTHATADSMVQLLTNALNSYKERVKQSQQGSVQAPVAEMPNEAPSMDHHEMPYNPTPPQV